MIGFEQNAKTKKAPHEERRNGGLATTPGVEPSIFETPSGRNDRQTLIPNQPLSHSTC